MNIITRATKLDMSYEFYIKHKLEAIERKLNAMINSDKNLINKLNRSWGHLLIKTIESYRA